jgi:hypothetical protein
MNIINAQNSIDCYQGIWHRKYLIEGEKIQPNNLFYEVIVDNKALTIYYESINENYLEFHLIGFQDSLKRYNKEVNIKNVSLNNEGRFLTNIECDSTFLKKNNAYWSVIKYFNCNEIIGEREENSLITERIIKLPNAIITFIINEIRNKNQQYLQRFLVKKYSLISYPKVIIFSNLRSPTKMYLLKNDPVEVTEEKDNWLKIKYYPEKNGEWTGKTIEGWIKKSDVE